MYAIRPQINNHCAIYIHDHTGYFILYIHWSLSCQNHTEYFFFFSRFYYELKIILLSNFTLIKSYRPIWPRSRTVPKVTGYRKEVFVKHESVKFLSFQIKSRSKYRKPFSHACSIAREELARSASGGFRARCALSINPANADD